MNIGSAALPNQPPTILVHYNCANLQQSTNRSIHKQTRGSAAQRQASAAPESDEQKVRDDRRRLGIGSAFVLADGERQVHGNAQAATVGNARVANPLRQLPTCMQPRTHQLPQNTTA